MKTRIMLALVALLGGCASMQVTLDDERRAASSGQIGCSSVDISISDGTQYTWKATCKGRVFQCTAAPAMACAELLK